MLEGWAVAGVAEDIEDNPTGTGALKAGADSSPATSEGAPPVRPRAVAIATLGVVVVLVVVLDLITKQLALTHLRPYQPVRILGGSIYFVLTRNAGAAFSMGTHYTWIFPVFAVIVVAAIIWLCRRLRSVGWAIALGLIVGGALGNVGDRLFRAPGPLRGQVVDFISLFSNDGAGWAIFNIADSALTVGVIVAILLELFGRRRDGVRPGAVTAASTDGHPEGDRDAGDDGADR